MNNKQLFDTDVAKAVRKVLKAQKGLTGEQKGESLQRKNN